MSRSISKYKKHSIVGITTLLFIGIAASLVMLLFMINDSKAKISSLEDKIMVQGDDIYAMRSDLAAINAQNGTALSNCLDTAARNYDNALKQGGTVTPNGDGSNTTTHNYNEWTKANDKLLSDRNACNSKFNKT